MLIPCLVFSFLLELEDYGFKVEEIEKFWTRLPLDTETLGQPSHSKGYTMAILYMLHIETHMNKRPKDIKGYGGIERLRLLKNYATWVSCRCNGGCDLKWNFANDHGLFKGSGRENCEISKGDKGRAALARTEDSWKSR